MDKVTDIKVAATTGCECGYAGGLLSEVDAIVLDQFGKNGPMDLLIHNSIPMVVLTDGGRDFLGTFSQTCRMLGGRPEKGQW